MNLQELTRQMIDGNKQFREQSGSVMARTVSAIREGDSDELNNIIRDITDVSFGRGEDRPEEREAGAADRASGV